MDAVTSGHRSPSVKEVFARRAIAFLSFVLLITDAGAAPESAEFGKFLETYCYSCHGSEKPKGDLDLTVLITPEAFAREPKAWDKVVQQVGEREMPPRNKPQPTNPERETFLAAIKERLANPDPALVPKDPGRKPLHRLNHEEYENTIRDLLGVEFDAKSKFPADGSGGGGFDNNASTLFIPPLLFEKYFAAAEEIVGKIPTEKLQIAHVGVFVSKKEAAEKTLKHYLERAFRRPLEKGEVDRYLKVYTEQIARGQTHEGGLKVALRAILVSPQFLFRIDRDSPGSEPARINDYELASRLSYFLWSSMPDAALFRLAEKGRLHEKAVLEREVERMLRDSRSASFSENFVGQWLHVRDLRTSAQPDPRKYPEYTAEVKEAFYQEPIALFHHLLQENGSLLQLIENDFTFLNEASARIYGVEGIQGPQLRRVKLENRNRGGLLTMPAVLTLTSYPLRTSPVLRGKWILEEVLGTPPPPPPPLVPSLPPDDGPRKGLTLRQRLEKHREDPNCASCHQKLDPLGFALENFDGIGRWRDTIGKDPVDSSGELANGEKISGPAELKKAILQRKELFVRNITERMLSYALGRGLEYYDIPTVKSIAEKVSKENHSTRTLLMEIVQSYPFQYRRAEKVDVAQK